MRDFPSVAAYLIMQVIFSGANIFLATLDYGIVFAGQRKFNQLTPPLPSSLSLRTWLNIILLL